MRNTIWHMEPRHPYAKRNLAYATGAFYMPNDICHLGPVPGPANVPGLLYSTLVKILFKAIFIILTQNLLEMLRSRVRKFMTNKFYKTCQRGPGKAPQMSQDYCPVLW